MHTPTTKRRWNYELGHTIAQGGSALATNRALWRDIVTRLLSIPGVAVYRSCDSVAAGAAGDGINRWDSDSDLVWAAGAHSWMVLSLPDGIRYGSGTTAYLTIDLGYASANGVLGAVYLAETVSGGSTTARPSGTKEILLPTIAGGALLPTPTTGYGINIEWAVRSPVEVGDDYAVSAIRLFIVNPADGTNCSTMLLEQPDPAASETSIANPIAGWDFTSGADCFSPLNLQGTCSLRTWVSASVDLLVVVSAFDGNFLEEGGGFDRDSSGRLIFYPVRLAASFGYVVTLSDLYFVDAATLYTLCPGGTGPASRAWVTIGNLATPNEPDANNVGSVTSEDPIALAPAVGSHLAGLSPVNGETLGSTRDAARWQPIALVVTAPGGALPLILGHFGSDPGIRHVIYDGTAFTPLFEDSSTVTQSGGVYMFSLLPLGGWWDAPTIRAGAFTEAI